MSIAIQGAGLATYYCIECDCCGRTKRNKFRANPEDWAVGKFAGKIRHICDYCQEEYLTGDRHMEWRW